MGDLRIGSYVDFTLRRENQFTGELINTFYCRSCGYIELYKDMRNRCPQCYTYYDRDKDKCPQCGRKHEE
jgi:rRNA maturation endonuclease Nob1